MTPTTPRQVLTFGETMGLATSATTGSLSHQRHFDIGFGGAETNVAIGLRRLGIPVTWLSRLGDDSVGRMILRELAAEGVDTRVELDTTAPTGFMLKERHSTARTNVTYYRRGSAASKLSPADLPSDAFTGVSLLHVTGITPALSPTALDATVHAVHTATAAGIPVSFDLNYRSKLWSAEQAADAFRILITASDVVFAGTEEAQLLFPELSTSVDLAHALADLGAREVVIKEGEDGCTALIDGVVTSWPAVPVEVVDTVGAGDAFVAGYLSQYIVGGDAEARLARAVLTGALACLVAGDWEGAPHERDLRTIDSAEPVSR